MEMNGLLTFGDKGGHLCAEEGLEELDVEAIFEDSIG